MTIHIKPVAFVKNSRSEAIDDHWGTVMSEIVLADHIPTEAFDHIEDFSHLEIIYYFDKIDPSSIVYSGRPRGNPAFPLMGIFAQRKKDRPNAIGLTTVQLIGHERRAIRVKYLDAIDGTPILDIKPVFKEFMPPGEITQPEWVGNLMKEYWK